MLFRESKVSLLFPFLFCFAFAALQTTGVDLCGDAYRVVFCLCCCMGFHYVWKVKQCHIASGFSMCGKWNNATSRPFVDVLHWKIGSILIGVIGCMGKGRVE